MELTRKLVEEDQRSSDVWRPSARNTNAAVQPYLNSKKVPQLSCLVGRSGLGPAARISLDHGLPAELPDRSPIYAQYLLENHPRGKIAVLYQDDGMGKEYLKGLKDGLGGKIPIVAEAPYKVTDTIIDPQIAKLKASGADIFIDFTTPKFATMAIRRTAELGWRPVHFARDRNSYSAGCLSRRAWKMRKACCRPAYCLEADDAADAPATRRFANGALSCSAMSPSVCKSNGQAVLRLSLASNDGRGAAKNCGDDLSRENIMRQAATLKGLQIPMMVPGIAINTSPMRSCADRADADDALHERQVAALRPGAKRHRCRQPSANPSRRSSSTAPPPSAIWRTSSTPTP